MSKTICVTSRVLVKGDFLTQIEQVLKSGVEAVILREKDLSEKDYGILAGKVNLLCKTYGIPLHLHTYKETAKEMGIRKIHLSYQDFLALELEEKEWFERIGVSIHAVEEAQRAEREGASYLTAGHIFATDCKKGVPPRGIPFLEEVCKAVKIPVYGIGGITEENKDACLAAGAEGICLMSSLMSMPVK